MKRFSEQFYKKAQTVKLKKTERDELRERIVSYMEYHPLPAELKTAQPKQSKRLQQPLAVEAFTTYRLPFGMFAKLGGVFALLVLIIVPIMAERAVPGDTLYAVKVKINEEVRSSLTLDPYEKIEWETVRINRRIAEAKLLAKEGRLTEAAEAEAAAAVKEHADNVKAEIETLRAADADEAAIAEIAFDSTMQVQAKSFKAQSESASSSTTTDATDLIAVAIDESLKRPVNQATTSLPALPKLTARVEQTTTRLRELETTIARQVADADATDISRRITDIERMAAEALALDETETAAAQAILVDVLARAQRLIVFMTDLEVRETVPLETVVPVVLTTDEKRIIRTDRITEIDTRLEQLATAEVEDEAVSEKLVATLERLADERATLDTAETFADFIFISDELLALTEDALTFIDPIEATAPVDAPEAATSFEAVATTSTTTTPTPEEAPDTTATSGATTTTPATTTPADPATTSPDAATSTTNTAESLDESN